VAEWCTIFYEDSILYIPDPTLAFVGITHLASTFSLYDFQAQILAIIFAGCGIAFLYSTVHFSWTILWFTSFWTDFQVASGWI
jgi:hypothetical protein